MLNFHGTKTVKLYLKSLKDLIMTSGTLLHPDLKPFQLQTDAFNSSLGAVLLQQDHDKQWQPVCFASCSLTKLEQNYSTTEKELLAIVYAFAKSHPYLHGSNVEYTFTLHYQGFCKCHSRCFVPTSSFVS